MSSGFPAANTGAGAPRTGGVPARSRRSRPGASKSPSLRAPSAGAIRFRGPGRDRARHCPGRRRIGGGYRRPSAVAGLRIGRLPVRALPLVRLPGGERPLRRAAVRLLGIQPPIPLSAGDGLVPPSRPPGSPGDQGGLDGVRLRAGVLRRQVRRPPRPGVEDAPDPRRDRHAPAADGGGEQFRLGAGGLDLYDFPRRRPLLPAAREEGVGVRRLRGRVRFQGAGPLRGAGAVLAREEAGRGAAVVPRGRRGIPRHPPPGLVRRAPSLGPAHGLCGADAGPPGPQLPVPEPLADPFGRLALPLAARGGRRRLVGRGAGPRGVAESHDGHAGDRRYPDRVLGAPPAVPAAEDEQPVLLPGGGPLAGPGVLPAAPLVLAGGPRTGRMERVCGHSDAGGDRAHCRARGRSGAAPVRPARRAAFPPGLRGSPAVAGGRGLDSPAGSGAGGRGSAAVRPGRVSRHRARLRLVGRPVLASGGRRGDGRRHPGADGEPLGGNAVRGVHAPLAGTGPGRRRGPDFAGGCRLGPRQRRPAGCRSRPRGGRRPLRRGKPRQRIPKRPASAEGRGPGGAGGRLLPGGAPRLPVAGPAARPALARTRSDTAGLLRVLRRGLGCGVARGFAGARGLPPGVPRDGGVRAGGPVRSVPGAVRGGGLPFFLGGGAGAAVRRGGPLRGNAAAAGDGSFRRFRFLRWNWGGGGGALRARGCGRFGTGTWGSGLLRCSLGEGLSA